jgi:hypothetical protein
MEILPGNGEDFSFVGWVEAPRVPRKSNRKDAKEIRFIRRLRRFSQIKISFAARVSAAKGGNLQKSP